MLKLPPLTRNLAAALRDATNPREKVRLSAISDLGVLATEAPQAVSALEAALARDESEPVRSAAAVALADCSARAAVPSLVLALDDAHPKVRQMALLALGELAEGSSEVVAAIEPMLDDPLPALRFQALVALVALQSPGDSYLQRGLGDPDAEVRLVALRLLGIREGVVAPSAPWLSRVREQFSDPSPTLRMAAGLVLVKSADRAAESGVCALLNDPGVHLSEEEEQHALEVVADLGLMDAVPGLRRRARSSWFGSNSSVWPARVALAVLGDEQGRGQILRGLTAWSWETRTQAVVAAGHARLQAARAKLEALRDRPSAADPQAVQDALRRIASGPKTAAQRPLVHPGRVD